jgi:hypothetical protein
VADKPIQLFSRVVIALNGGSCDDRIVRLVVEAARPTKSEVVAIHVVEIDWTLPLDASVAERSEAVEREADLLVVGLPYRKKFGGDFAIGRTVPYVLKNAPCAVWVVREPMPAEVHA